MRDVPPPSSRRSPSLHESHDAPGAPAQWELDLVLGRIAVLEDELRVQRQRLDALRAPSSPPDGTTEVRTAGGTRVRAPWWVAITLSIVVLAIVAVWRAKDLAVIVK
jgi:hypothetical protein